jgi:hypothetical protein
MKHLAKQTIRLAVPIAGILLLAACASTKVTDRQREVHDRLPRPGHIHIYDFGSSPSDVANDSSLATQGAPTVIHPTDEQAALARELGMSIATHLVEDIKEMGLPAVPGIPGTQPQVNDIVIRGYLVSIEQGSTAKRMTIGFGSGGSELTTLVEGYQMTPQGLRKLGSAVLGAKGSKGPGAALGAAGWLVTGSPIGLIVGGGMKVYGEASGSAKVEGRAKQTAKEIADQLKIRFEEEGWIQ